MEALEPPPQMIEDELAAAAGTRPEVVEPHAVDRLAVAPRERRRAAWAGHSFVTLAGNAEQRGLSHSAKRFRSRAEGAERHAATLRAVLHLDDRVPQEPGEPVG